MTVRDDGPVRHLTINRPEERNALNAGVFDALEAALDDVAAGGVRVVVLAGAGGRAFSAGADLDELRGLDGIAARELLARGGRVIRRLETLGVPSIAAVRGWALGGGFELALACSLVVAGHKARFGLPEAGLGLMPGYGGTQRLTRQVGAKAALAVMLTGDHIGAARAWELGLLARPPVEDEQVEDAAAELAARLASRSPSALRLILEAVDTAGPQDAGLAHETALAALATSSADAVEGIAAFLDKRDPRVRGPAVMTLPDEAIAERAAVARGARRPRPRARHRRRRDRPARGGGRRPVAVPRGGLPRARLRRAGGPADAGRARRQRALDARLRRRHGGDRRRLRLHLDALHDADALRVPDPAGGDRRRSARAGCRASATARPTARSASPSRARAPTSPPCAPSRGATATTTCCRARKTFITTGDRADVAVIFATVDRDAGRDGVTAFLVERGHGGLRRPAACCPSWA